MAKTLPKRPHSSPLLEAEEPAEQTAGEPALQASRPPPRASTEVMEGQQEARIGESVERKENPKAPPAVACRGKRGTHRRGASVRILRSRYMPCPPLPSQQKSLHVVDSLVRVWSSGMSVLGGLNCSSCFVNSRRMQQLMNSHSALTSPLG